MAQEGAPTPSIPANDGDDGVTCPPHHWRIDSPNGSKKLPGVYSGCGATRLFHTTDYEMSKNWRHGSVGGSLLGMGDLTDLRGGKERARKPPKQRMA